MRRFFVFLLLALCSVAAKAQQATVTVMQYNLLQYGNYQGYGGCSETTNNTQRKDECIRTILDYVKPDILTVCEFGATQQLQTDFLRHNLNVGDVNYWKSDNILNYAHSNLINHIFYDSRKMELKKHVALLTSPRDSDVYELYMKTSGLIAGDTIKLVCIVTHPKAGDGVDDAASRLATMQTIMNYINQHYTRDNVLIMGDFNMYSSYEKGYQLLTQTYENFDARFCDPLANEGGVGAWNNNYQFAQFHTQSTRSSSSSCFSSGGLDDRFDFILISDEIYVGLNKIKYLDGSYVAVGNDGNHFNKSINQNGNTAVSAEVAQALYDGSDHLPVSLKMSVHGNVGIEENEMAWFNVYPNPTNDILHVDLPSMTNRQEYRIVNMVGQILKTGRLDGSGIDVSALADGLYFISVNGLTKKFVKSTVVR